MNEIKKIEKELSNFEKTIEKDFKFTFSKLIKILKLLFIQPRLSRKEKKKNIIIDKDLERRTFENNFLKIYFALGTIFGSKSKVDKMNQKSINEVYLSKGKKELTIIIHGTSASYYRTMYPMLKWFRKNDIPAVSIGYNSRYPVNFAALSIKEQIEEVMKKAKTKKINLIGVCLGGVISRYYVEKLDGRYNINKLITVFSPLKPVNKSSPAYLLHQLLDLNIEKNNKFVKEIENSFSVKDYIALYGMNDYFIGFDQYPSKKNITQVPIEGGHLFVSFNVSAMKAALAFLKGKKI
ncbi:MAG: hypothetical protein WC867_02685 [Candidatus Pacearchaeota archaeon]|jgi:hypothetical protein